MRRVTAGLCGAALLALWPGWSPVAGGADDEAPPPPGVLLNAPLAHYAYQAGEYLGYRISWSGANAGHSAMEIAEGVAVDGSPVLEIISTAESGDFVSVFFPVKDRVVSQLDVVEQIPRRIHIDQRHGRRTRVRTVVFDQAGQSATTFQPGRDPVTVKTPPRVHDILSCLYYFRSLPDLTEGKTSYIDVHEGKKNWRLAATVEGHEKIKVPAGKFDTVRVRAEVRFRGVFYDRGEVHLWLTDDVHRIPVRVRVKIQIGSVVIDLTDLRLGTPAPEAVVSHPAAEPSGTGSPATP
ncbi:MAG: DUF3108 domain-containing protein [Nitrospirota bacterium]|nr:DUF3108 domain-containing protein [Nitrospirota bacterium]